MRTVVDIANRISAAVKALPSLASRHTPSAPADSPRQNQSTHVGVVIKEVRNGICGNISWGVHSFHEEANNKSANPAIPRVYPRKEVEAVSGGWGCEVKKSG